MPTIIKCDPRAREKPCLRCGYSLRKIPDSKNCPECGLPIWISLSGLETFDLTNPDWIRKIRNATYSLFIAQLLGFLVVLSIFTWAGPLWSLAWVLFPLLYLLAYPAGLLMLTWPENRYPDRLKPYRIWARIAAVASLLLLGWIVYPGLVLWTYPPLVSSAVLLCCALATWPLLRKLLQRVPHPKLARWAGYAMLPPGSALLLLFPAVGYIVIVAFPWLLLVMAGIYLLGSAILLCFIARAFDRCIPEAQNNWSSKG